MFSRDSLFYPTLEIRMVSRTINIKNRFNLFFRCKHNYLIKPKNISCYASGNQCIYLAPLIQASPTVRLCGDFLAWLLVCHLLGHKIWAQRAHSIIFRLHCWIHSQGLAMNWFEQMERHMMICETFGYKLALGQNKLALIVSSEFVFKKMMVQK